MRALECSQRHAQVIPGIGKPRPHTNGLLKELNPLRVLTRLAADQSKHVQSIGIPRVRREHFAVLEFRFVIAAGSVMLQAGRQKVGYVSWIAQE